MKEHIQGSIPSDRLSHEFEINLTWKKKKRQKKWRMFFSGDARLGLAYSAWGINCLCLRTQVYFYA